MPRHARRMSVPPPEPPHYWCVECKGRGGDCEDGKCLACDGRGIVEINPNTGEVVRDFVVPLTPSTDDPISTDFGSDDIPF